MPASHDDPSRRPASSRSLAKILAAGVLTCAMAACGNGGPSPSTAPLESPSASSAAGTTAPATSSESATTGTSSLGTPGTTATPAPSAAATPTAAASLRYPLPPVTVSLQKLAGGLPQPVAVANAGDSRLFVVGQKGQVVVVQGGKTVATFLDLSTRISCCGERGLLGLAFHPNYASNGRFFVRYTDPTGDVRISEFHRSSSDPNRADPGSERVLLTVPHRTYSNHNGGTIAFGPDGYLYIGTGDGGGGGDPFGNGQKLSVVLGKLLRIDVDHTSGGLPYGIPSDNPFAGRSDARPEIWAYGLRNPYGFSFDRRTGDLWIADVGQNVWEEVDRARAADGGGKGANYGWSVLEARHCYNPSSGCDTAGKVPPIAEYSHTSNGGNGCAIIGGFVYRGSAHPELAGRYFFGDYCSGRIWDLDASGPAEQTPQLLSTTSGGITGIGEGADAELYVTAADGTVYSVR